ncbi:MAG: restriction endonuclease subunit S [Solirubrobacteraceae bacterium]
MTSGSTVPTRRLFRVVNGGTPTADAENWSGEVPWATPVDLAKVDGGVLETTERTLTDEGLRTGSRRVGSGSLIISTRAPIGYVVEVQSPTAFNQGCRGLEPSVPMDVRFFRYQFSAAAERLAAMGQGSTFVELSSDALATFPLTAPSLDSQRAIADFLDRETVRIDAIVAAKEKALALYGERRQALRDRAFGSASGLRLKHLLAAPMAYGVLVPEFVLEGDRVPMIRTYNLTPRGNVKHGDIAEIPRSLADQYRRTYLQDGDVVLSVVGSMGRSAVVTRAETGFNLNRPLARLRPRPELPSRLLWHWTQTTQFADAAALATGGGTAQPTLNLGDLANFSVGLPADVEDWTHLLAELDTSCARLDQLEDAASNQVALLAERRQALITTAITRDDEAPVAA